MIGPVAGSLELAALGSDVHICVGVYKAKRGS